MKSYAQREAFTSESLRLHAFATRLVEAVPSHLGDVVRCHELARAVAEMLRPTLATGDEIHVQDGTFGPAVAHSWIEYHTSERGYHRYFRIDVYAPGVHPQVLLVDSHFAVRAAIVHVPQTERDDIDHKLVQRIAATLQHVAETKDVPTELHTT